MNKAEDLIKRIKDYYQEANVSEDPVKLNDYSTTNNGRKYIEICIRRLEHAKPFSMQFNAEYHRLVEFKKYLEQNKKL